MPKPTPVDPALANALMLESQAMVRTTDSRSRGEYVGSFDNWSAPHRMLPDVDHVDFVAIAQGVEKEIQDREHGRQPCRRCVNQHHQEDAADVQLVPRRVEMSQVLGD
jgi:hypothetical protein